MYITWHGHSCFRITGKAGLDEVTLVMDPYNDLTGLKPSRAAADVVTVNNTTSPELDSGTIPDPRFVIDSPGEYEVKKVYIEGIGAQGALATAESKDTDKNADKIPTTLFVVQFEDLKLVHLGHLGGELTPEQTERLEGCDVLFLPIGGHGVLTSKQALELVSVLEPMIIIPMMYRVAGLKLEYDVLDPFAKEMGVKPEDHLPKLKLSKKDVQEGEMKAVVLEKA